MKNPHTQHIAPLLALAVCLLVCRQAVSRPRTPEQAIDIAVAHTAQAYTKLPARDTLAHDILPAIAHRSTGYYAVNTLRGFVLVSADDALPPVLGYSDVGEPFCLDSLPPAMCFWLQTYDEEQDFLTYNPQETPSPRRMAPAVQPILTSKWNQRSPYNLLAPCYSANNHAAAGCVATAMAQIMYAYQYPDKGTGAHTYQWESQNDPALSATLSADFANTTYRWQDMLPAYTAAASEESQTAVATLIYHCGVAVDMNYDCNASHESSAVTSKVPAALADWFGYDTRYQAIRKDIYSADSLEKIIYEDISLLHPVLVSGSNDEGGHAFVCDGYDGKGYFHFNWGWGGSSDGYFLLSALNPGTQGVGGTSKGYNKNTTFFIGLQPATTEAKVQPQQLAADSITVSAQTIARTASFSASAYRIQNYGLDDYQNGAVGVALYDEDETRMIALLKSTSFSLRANYYRTSAQTLSDITIPSSVSDGTYRLCFVYNDPVYGWSRMLTTMDDYYKTLYLTSTQIEFADNHAPASLVLAAPIAFPNADSVAATGEPLAFSILNTGGTFRGDISARIYQGNFTRGQYEIMDSVTIRHNQTFTSALQQAFDANLNIGTTYKMKLCYRTGESDPWHELAPTEYNALPFVLYLPEETEQEPDKPTAIQMAVPDGAIVLREQLLMRLPVGNLLLVTTEENNTIHHYKIIKTL